MEQFVDKPTAPPGMIGAVLDSTGIRMIQAVGVRKAATSIPLLPTDRVHIGSCTKAFTAVVIARLIDKKLLDWDTTLATVFPEFQPTIHPDYLEITVKTLLTHRAGLPRNPTEKDLACHLRLPIVQARKAIVKASLSEAPKNTKGMFLYSNLGYLLLGSMAEKISGRSWETLMAEYIFAPLKMTTVGFGFPGTAGKVDQPWGHRWVSNQWLPLQEEYPAFIGPAGTLHCSLGDWAKFVATFLKKSPVLISQQQMQRLTQPIDDIASGWFVTHTDWAEGPVLFHTGSNTLWYASVWIAPTHNRAYIAAVNAGGPFAEESCKKLIQTLIDFDYPEI
ncbi:MAG: serine hydrolase domain-containing protein [Flavobacteriaceae bacterium]